MVRDLEDKSKTKEALLVQHIVRVPEMLSCDFQHTSQDNLHTFCFRFRSLASTGPPMCPTVSGVVTLVNNTAHVCPLLIRFTVSVNTGTEACVGIVDVR